MGRKSQNRLLTGQHNDLELLYSVLTDLNALSFSVGGKRCAVLVGKGREKWRSLTLPGHISQGRTRLSKAFLQRYSTNVVNVKTALMNLDCPFLAA